MIMQRVQWIIKAHNTCMTEISSFLSFFVEITCLSTLLIEYSSWVVLIRQTIQPHVNHSCIISTTTTPLKIVTKHNLNTLPPSLFVSHPAPQYLTWPQHCIATLSWPSDNHHDDTRCATKSWFVLPALACRWSWYVWPDSLYIDSPSIVHNASPFEHHYLSQIIALLSDTNRLRYVIHSSSLYKWYIRHVD